MRFERDAAGLGCLTDHVGLLSGSLKLPELSHLPLYVLRQVCFSHLVNAFYKVSVFDRYVAFVCHSDGMAIPRQSVRFLHI